jgi:hypothetical protein
MNKTKSITDPSIESDLMASATKRFGDNPKCLNAKELIEWLNDCLEDYGYPRTMNMDGLINIIGSVDQVDEHGNLKPAAMKLFFPGYDAN